MNRMEACTAWIRVLRSVAAGETSPADALTQIPHVDDDATVPSAFWSARDLLEQEVEFGLQGPDGNDYFRGVMTKLANRIEDHLESDRP
jgi:hypothetical protein